MTGEQVHRTEHTITVAARPEHAYDVIADVSAWPHLFPPTVHAEEVSREGDEQVIRLWAFANGEVRSWTSRRWLDETGLRIRFRQEASSAPVASMGGEWIMRPSDGGTEVALLHDFTAVDDDPAQVEWITKAIDRNSGQELESLRQTAERLAGDDRLVVSFADSVVIDGKLPDVYDFIYRCQDWPDRLPHVSRLDVAEDDSGVQVMEMDTRSPDGDVHTTKSVRVCFADDRIVYKQTMTPKIMTAHTGEWQFAECDDGVLATSRHTVMIAADAVPDVLGPDRTVDDARGAIRTALGTNSLTTLRRAKAYVENGHG
ncbi:MAG TPA: aromatase/cyclase [Pseudonocardiaceae bacterium]|nr:aromatase/cyclase [Pseudonocardiaceae bacterium]